MAGIGVTGAGSSRAHVVKGGIVAGLIGGVVLAVFMMIVGAARGQDLWIGMKMAAYPFLGDRVMTPGFDVGPVLLGVISHFAVSIVWGVFFAVLVFGRSRTATVWLGTLWGFVVWIGMFYVVLPIVGAGAVARGAPVGLAIVEHVLFGLAVGVGFLPYQRLVVGRRWAARRPTPVTPIP